MYTPGVPGYDKSLPLFMQGRRERGHIGAGCDYRHSLRPTTVIMRDHVLNAYLIDSLNPSTITPVDLNVAATCEFGFCDDGGGETWEKEIAFIFREQAYVAPFDGTSVRSRQRYKINFQARIISGTDVAPPSFTVGLGKYSAAFTGNVITWENRPAVTGPFHQYLLHTNVFSTASLAHVSASNLWSASVLGSGADDAVGSYNVCGTTTTSENLNQYGYRLSAARYGSAGAAYTLEVKVQLLAWGILCE
jgi:hypothetical protein